ncbi:helix-turn-helix domain-containing protein [Candidatus Poseidoniales archaeon]|jgi:DNA invertase Pin-like site-specific DNA recombinase|nr:helix-turn-helix domain-containing protein [Candidatus Poseidoniales archaeon]
MNAVYIYANPNKNAEIRPYIEVVTQRWNELGWEGPPVVYTDGFANANNGGMSELMSAVNKGKVESLMLFSLEAWTSERHKFVPVVGKLLQSVKGGVSVACAPGLGILKGMKDLAKLEGLFLSGEYFSNLNSVAVKVGMSKSTKKKGRPSLLDTDREFVRQVAVLYNQSLSTKGISQRLGVSYHKVYRAIKHLHKEEPK